MVVSITVKVDVRKDSVFVAVGITEKGTLI